MSRDTSDIEREVEVRRNEVTRTLDAIRNKLSTGEIVESVTRSIADAGSTGNEVAGTLGRQIKENPLPVVITGVGLALLIAGQANAREPAPQRTAAARDADDETDGARADETAAAPQGDGEDAATRAQSDSRAEPRDATGDVAKGVQAATERAWRGVTGFVREQPLIAAALGIAVGAAMGAAFPARRQRRSGNAKDADESGSPPGASAGSQTAE